MCIVQMSPIPSSVAKSVPVALVPWTQLAGLCFVFVSAVKVGRLDKIGSLHSQYTICTSTKSDSALILVIAVGLALFS